MQIARRAFLRQSAALAAGFLGLRTLVGCGPSDGFTAHGYGPLRPDPKGILDLPAHFSYQELSATGDAMDDGFLVPGNHDAMAAFPGPDGKTLLIRNHELEEKAEKKMFRGAFGKQNELFPKIDPGKVYDAGKGKTPALGGTTTLLFDTRTRRLEKQFLSLAGTLRNCAGGPTPWNSWLTCEESVAKNHGYTFEVPASATPALADPVPLKAMGRFNHEAAAVDPRSGCVYQTEDRKDGLLYRFVPLTPGRLARGGRLQALKVRDKASADLRSWIAGPRIPIGQAFEVEWIDLKEVESPKDDLRKRGFAAGAALFTRGEGMWTGKDAIYFTSTDGGRRRKGQVWRYFPSPVEGQTGESGKPGRLELFIEPNDGDILENCDNITVAPWGDLVLCEDGPGQQFVVGVTPQGRLYRIAQNARNRYEFAGACFSPDGTTLFINVQKPGVTFAITGDFASVVATNKPQEKSS